MAGLGPLEIKALTLPELLITLRGWQRANGLNPDERGASPMTHERLLALIEKDQKNGNY